MQFHHYYRLAVRSKIVSLWLKFRAKISKRFTTEMVWSCQILVTSRHEQFNDIPAITEFPRTFHPAYQVKSISFLTTTTSHSIKHDSLFDLSHHFLSVHNRIWINRNGVDTTLHEEFAKFRIHTWRLATDGYSFTIFVRLLRWDGELLYELLDSVHHRYVELFHYHGHSQERGIVKSLGTDGITIYIFYWIDQLR